MKYIYTFFAAMLLVAACGEIARDLVPADGTRMIRNGELADDNNAKFVGLLYSENDVGTGFAVCPNLVLTSAHVVEGDASDFCYQTGVEAKNTLETVGKDKCIDVKRKVFTGRANTDGHDITLVELEEPLAAEYVTKLKLGGKPTARTQNILMGYGFKDGAEGGIGTRRKAWVPFDRTLVESRVDEITGKTYYFGLGENGEVAMPGDSGGPLLVIGPSGKNWEIAGVISKNARNKKTKKLAKTLVTALDPYLFTILAKIALHCKKNDDDDLKPSNSPEPPPPPRDTPRPRPTRTPEPTPSESPKPRDPKDPKPSISPSPTIEPPLPPIFETPTPTATPPLPPAPPLVYESPIPSPL